jgi:hypothetical protein
VYYNFFYLVHDLLQKYNINLDEIEEDLNKEYLQTDVLNNHDNTEKLVKKVLKDSKHKYRPSLNKSDLLDNAPKLNTLEKKEVSAKSAHKGHNRRTSTAAEIYSFNQEIKNFRKHPLKIEEKSEHEENDETLSPKKRHLTRKSAADPIIKNSFIKKKNFAKKITATNINKNKKEDSNYI